MICLFIYCEKNKKRSRKLISSGLEQLQNYAQTVLEELKAAKYQNQY